MNLNGAAITGGTSDATRRRTRSASIGGGAGVTRTADRGRLENGSRLAPSISAARPRSYSNGTRTGGSKLPLAARGAVARGIATTLDR
jgi:hypothetical protein